MNKDHIVDYQEDHNPDLQKLVSITYDEMQIGQQASLSRTITNQDIQLFAIVSGDVNPAHLEKSFAQQTIFHDVVAHGMLSGALVSTVLGTRLPGPGTIYLNQSLRFAKPVRINDVITAIVTVLEKKPNFHVTLNCECYNQNKEIVSSGIAEVIAPKNKLSIDKPILPELEILEPGRLCRSFIEQAKKLPNKARVAVVYPCSDVALQGASEAFKHHLIEPVLVGPRQLIQKIAGENGIDITGMEIVEVALSNAAAQTSVELVESGRVDFLMKGSLHTSEFLKSIVNPSNSLHTTRRISHCCVMDIPHYPQPLLVSDIAINIAPTLMEKKDIVQNAIDLAHSLGIELPKVAILSAEETISPNMQSSIDAAVLCKMADRGQIYGATLDGPLSFDVALSSTAANIKQVKSPIAGNPDILIAPSIEAANILAKEFKYFTHSYMPGLVLGTKVPMILTSRADDSLSRVASCALAVIYNNYHKQKE